MEPRLIDMNCYERKAHFDYFRSSDYTISIINRIFLILMVASAMITLQIMALWISRSMISMGDGKMDPDEYVSYCGTHCDHIVIPEPLKTAFLKDSGKRLRRTAVKLNLRTHMFCILQGNR